MDNTNIIELRVDNHAGVMSHITGLFARRSFNLEGIACLPEKGGETSRMFLLVRDDERLVQVEKQLRKLYDVLDVIHHDADEGNVFQEIAILFNRTGKKVDAVPG